MCVYMDIQPIDIVYAMLASQKRIEQKLFCVNRIEKKLQITYKLHSFCIEIPRICNEYKHY